MHYPFSSLAMAVMLGQLEKAIAIPRGAPICEHSTSAYSIQSQTIGPGTPVTGSVTCPGEGGTCVLSSDVSYSVGVTVEVGASLDLNFNDIVSAGLTTSVAITTETGTSQGVQINCPDGKWKCSLMITPSMVTVSGLQTPVNCLGHKSDDKAQPYTVKFPHKSANGLTGGQYEICTCGNYEHWADAGAPQPLCPDPCQ